MAPVSSFFVNADDDALFDEDSDRKPIMLTAEMRRDIEERVRREKEAKDRKRAHRRSSAEYQHVSADDGAAEELEMQETKETVRAGQQDDQEEHEEDDEDDGEEVGDTVYARGRTGSHALIANDEDEAL